jgi:hypothetical protein
LLGLSGPALGQALEPRAYSPAPVGMNFLVAGSAVTRGGLAEDPNLPFTEPDLTTASGVLGYVRTFDAGGKLGRIEAILPVTHADGRALFEGSTVTRTVTGLGDPSFRFSTILFGVPAMTPREFRSFRGDWLLGVSLQVTAPLGQDDPDRLVNIGTNRWTVRPEIGVSKAFGPLMIEGTASASLFTDNQDFFGGKRRSQAPLFASRAHVSWSFPRGGWVSFDTTWFTGGRTSIDGDTRDDRLSNWRSGATVSLPVGKSYSVRAYASKGVSARTGNNFDLLGVAVQYRWLDRKGARPVAGGLIPDPGS